eukprot:9886916-Alexandrium_andersonii.AAC.1
MALAHGLPPGGLGRWAHGGGRHPPANGGCVAQRGNGGGTRLDLTGQAQPPDAGGLHYSHRGARL